MRLIIKGVTTLFSYLIGFLLIIPILYFIPKQKNRICFIGRDNGLFLDNTKHLYLYLQSIKIFNNFDIFFITEDKNTYNLLKQNEIPVFLYPSYQSILKLSTSNILFVDNYQWIFNLKYFLLFYSYKIQLWHGIGFKKLGRTLVYEKNNLPLSRKLIEFFGLYLEQLLPNYNLFISTSEFYTNKVFRPAFRMKNIKEYGYPRNDILKRDFKNNNVNIFINTDNKSLESCKQFKESGYKLVLYAPTFRDSKSSNNITFTSFIDYCEKNRIKLIFKSHPDFVNNSFKNNTNIINYNNNCDVYPLLPLIDLLITDYSSIYMDYLLLNKPVIFYAHDLHEYIKSNRAIQFDYEWITPGPKCYDEFELIETVTQILVNNKDTFKIRREEILKIAFSNNDQNSSERIWNYIEKNLLS